MKFISLKQAKRRYPGITKERYTSEVSRFANAAQRIMKKGIRLTSKRP